MNLKFYAKTTTIAQETSRIKQLAEKVGIILPSTHTALFQSVYAPIDEANLNGVRLAKKAVDSALPRIIGSQVNLEHLGYGWIVGLILDSWINESNEIEIIYSFAKNIYKDEYTLALEAMSKNKLAVSFELLAETNAQEQLSDGTILLHDIDFQGVGMLITNPPAYPKAKTYEFASSIKNRIADIENKSFVFASQIEQKCDEILSEDTDDSKAKQASQDNSTEGGNKIVSEEQKAQVEALRAELGDVAKDVKDEDLLNETVVIELRKAYKETIDIKQKIVTESDGDTLKKTETTTVETTVDYKMKAEALEAEVAALKAKVEQLEGSLNAKESEIAVVRANAEKIATIKIQLQNNAFAKDFSDEDYLDEAKVSKAIQDKKNFELIASRRDELKENSYAKDFSDEDYLNDDKVELAKVKKEKDELQAKVPVTEVIASVANVEADLKTGSDDSTKETDKVGEVMASIRKQVKDNNKEQKVYTKK